MRREVLKRVFRATMEHPPRTLYRTSRRALPNESCWRKPCTNVGTRCRTISATPVQLAYGSSSQARSIIQCWITMASNFAYTSQRIRQSLPLVYSLSNASCFQSLKSNSICQRTFITTTACSRLISQTGALVRIMVQWARSNAMALTGLLCLSAYSRTHGCTLASAGPPQQERA